MRRLTDKARVEAFMRALGAEARQEVRVYFTGGVTAVLEGWRPSTLDIDLTLAPDETSLLRSLPRLKETLEVNVELAAPSHFIPELPDWQARCRFITREGKASFLHYDLYAQALAKIERGHEKDTQDVRKMLDTGLIEVSRLGELYLRIEPELFRYPAVDPKAFRRAVERVVGALEREPPVPPG